MFNEIKRLVKIMRVKIQRKHVRFSSTANFSQRTTFDGYNRVGKNSWVNGTIGYGSYIGDGCLIEARIGKYCSIGHEVKVLIGVHPAHIFVSTSPSFFSVEKQNGLTYVKEKKFKEKVYADEEKKYGVIIGNDVWIGYGAILVGGIVIGNGAIIGANAYINENVEPYSIVVGAPGKKIGARFSEQEIEFLEKLQWWDKPESWIRENAEKFSDIRSLINNGSTEL